MQIVFTRGSTIYACMHIHYSTPKLPPPSSPGVQTYITPIREARQAWSLSKGGQAIFPTNQIYDAYRYWKYSVKVQFKPSKFYTKNAGFSRVFSVTFGRFNLGLPHTFLESMDIIQQCYAFNFLGTYHSLPYQRFRRTVEGRCRRSDGVSSAIDRAVPREWASSTWPTLTSNPSPLYHFKNLCMYAFACISSIRLGVSKYQRRQFSWLRLCYTYCKHL